MDEKLVAEILTSDSDEIADLKANLNLLEGFIDLVREIDGLPDIKKRFYEESRSLYQTTAVGLEITELEKTLSKFFGEPIKSAGKALPRKFRKSSVVKYLGGIQKDQSLFTLDLKTGQFYGALWPWRRNKSKIEIHLGYCSDWMTDEDYEALERLVHQTVSHGAFAQMDTTIGGQIHGISLPSFLQMAEMEKSSFTLRVTSHHRVGELHLSEGNLFAASVDDYTGDEAAYRIISWDDASIDIEPLNEDKGQEINTPLMHVLMESLKLKDEAVTTQEEPPAQPKGRPKRKAPPAKKASAKRLVRLERAPAPMAPRKKTPILTLVGIGIGAFAVLAVIAVVTFHLMENRRTSDGYQELLSRVEKTNSLEKKIDEINKYIDAHPNSGYEASLKSQIKDFEQGIEDREFEQATLNVSGLVVDELYEAKAIEIYSQFLKKYPDSRHTEKINKSIAEIKNLLDQYYYEELKRAARLDFNRRLATYRKYLSQFPAGKYRQDVEILINDMGDKYLDYLHEEAKQCEKNKRWEPCIEHATKFIEAYTGLELSQKAVSLKNQLEDKRDFFKLLNSESEAGTDYQKGLGQFKRYLKENPQTTQRENIEKEITRLDQKTKEQRQWLAVRSFAANSKNDLYARLQKLDQYIRKHFNGPYAGDAQSLLEKLEQERQASLARQQIEAKKRSEQARIQRQQAEQARQKKRAMQLRAITESKIKGSSRYRSNGDGTFTDLTTGLSWTILDSYQELGGCMIYEDALKYVRNLRHGGHRAWRLPTAYELAAINKRAPYFPASGAGWYWSSETSVKGYHSVADVVTATQESVFQREQRALTECGAVRAILVPQP